MNIKHGSTLDLTIAVGKSRKELQWKNITCTWPEFVARISKTVTTYETTREFFAMSKSDQDTIKDVGGFVGGALKDGKRKNGFVMNRCIVSLDADFAPVGFWEDATLLLTHACACYSTHKHTEEKPRLRIIVPLTRPVSAEEYTPIARRIAADMGIEYFDDTTFEPARLMYWPSTSKDNQFFFKLLDAPILDPDKILASYPDWRDTSFWPESKRSAGIKIKLQERQGDPLTKGGIVGAFCRAYSIDDAIEKFLSDVYTKCTVANRYTYSKGTTHAGLVVYDGKFAYSNHGSDPACSKLCNSFDLVRVHLFSSLDLEARSGMPQNRLPSWEKMVALSQSDSAVRAQIGYDKVKDDFSSSIDPERLKEWTGKLSITKKGELENTIDNFILIIKNDSSLNGIGGHDLFRDRWIVLESLPWHRDTNSSWTDIDESSLRYYIEKKYKLTGKDKLHDALTVSFEDRAYNPVKEYIESVSWDGVDRVETLLIDYLGAEDNEYTRTVTRKALVAAVKRVYEPGCKFDYVLTLVGKQGIGKSLIIKKLGGEYASDTLIDIKGKDAYEALDGVWLMEMGELAALKKSERETIKNYISKQEDTYRKAYARNVTVNKRKCIFIGTTNDNDFLDDSTGNRRFWIVSVDGDKSIKEVWKDLTESEVSQLWSEALSLYRKGENVMYLPKEIAEQAQATQKEHTQTDAYEGLCQHFVNIPILKEWSTMSQQEHIQYYQGYADYGPGDDPSILMMRSRVSAIEIWVENMGGTTQTFNNAISRRINNCLESIGWIKCGNGPMIAGYGRQRSFIRPQRTGPNPTLADLKSKIDRI
jgi:predicted P-loop ATPase